MNFLFLSLPQTRASPQYTDAVSCTGITMILAERCHDFSVCACENYDCIVILILKSSGKCMICRVILILCHIIARLLFYLVNKARFLRELITSTLL